MMFDCRTMVVSVNGGSRGLGKTICAVFAQVGAGAATVSRKPDTCEIPA